MASYSAAVDILRGTEGGIDGIDGVAAEDMAAMQALLEEDERSQRTYAMAEDESLDYDVRTTLQRDTRTRCALLRYSRPLRGVVVLMR